jgi:hypothetical protein
MVKGPVEGLDPILPELTQLTHLSVREVSVASLEKFKNLRYLEVAYVRSGATTRPLAESPDFMSALAKLPHLRSLTLTGQEKHADSPGALCPAGLGRLKSLRNLTLVNLELPDLSPLAALTNLRSLTMVDPGPVTSLWPVGRLQELRALVIVPLPAQAKDLSPLAQLKHLEVLMVDKADLKERTADLDKIRAARPGLEIVGFCLGAAEILGLLPASMAVGLLLRRVRGRNRR